MGKLTDEQARQLAELEQLRDAPDDPEPDGDGDQDDDDDGHVIVLRGKRADSFLSGLLGSGKSKQSKSSKSSGEPAGDGDGDGEGDGDGDPDPEPPRTHRYFR